MRFEQVDAPAMDGHRRRVGQQDAVLDEQLETTVLPLRISRVGFEQHRDGGQRMLVVAELGAEPERVRHPAVVLGLGTSDRCTTGSPRAKPFQQPCCLNPALQQRAAERVRVIFRAELVQHLDDSIATKIRGVRHRRSPVARLRAACHLVEQLRVFQHERTHGAHVVSPDRVDHAAGEHKTRPAGDAVAARQRELRFCELRMGLLALHLAQQILRLVLELIEVRADGEMAIGHGGPPSMICPVSARSGERRFANEPSSGKLRWTQSFLRTGGVLHAASRIA
jgi:hypothetical protein